jgi:glucose/arabinose dehydrogenase
MHRYLSLGLAIALSACAPAPSEPIIVSATPQPVPETTKSLTPEVLISGLEHPWSMAWLPDGSMLITERAGRLRLVRNGQLDPQPIAGLPVIFARGQGGLLDIALHPNFSQNRLIYFSYSQGDISANRTVVARAVFDGKKLSQVQEIMAVDQLKPDAQHFGSRLLWLPNGTLLIAIGDGGNPPISLNGQLIRLQAQNKRSQLGKILRVNDDGSVPKDNPFVNQSDADPRLFSYGHRNIQGLALHPQTQQVWSTEHGARGGDELNLIRAGQNFGWPLVTHSREYFGPEISPHRTLAGMIDPVLVWQNTIAPSGLAWHNGKLYAGGLVSQDIKQIEISPQGTVIQQTSIPIGQRVRDVRSRDGWLYVLTDSPNGQLLRLRP